MNEVKVYDSSGNLKKVISAKELDKRAEQQLAHPALFKKNKGPIKPESKASAGTEKNEKTKP